MIVVGYGIAGTEYDFYLFDGAGRVWDGSGWVSWLDGDYLDYRIPAVESGGPGRFQAQLPTGAETSFVRFELRFRGATLAESYVIWTGELDGQVVATEDLSGVAAEILQTASGPASFAVDGQQVTAQPIPHLIEADKYLTRKRVTKRRGIFGQIAVAKVTPPGAVEE